LPFRRLPVARLPRTTLADALSSRRSAREWAPGPLALPALAAVLHAGYGVIVPRECGVALRSAPSGGALYPLEIYVVVRSVRRLQAGLYHYDPGRHGLEELRSGDVWPDLQRAVIAESLDRAAVAIVVAASFWRSRFKYGLRGYRFVLFETGHLAQNVLLACAALDVAACAFGGFYDRRLDDLLELDGVHESSLYAICIGEAAR
jgi:SagB-type dehydrogenase family enzyme